MNLSLSGGASKGLSYFRMWKEIDKKDIKFDNFSGSSAGVVMGVPIMFGLTAEQGADLLKKIKGDEYLAYNEEIKKARWIRKPFMLLKFLFILRRKFFKSCEEIVKFYFPTWDNLQRCKQFYGSFVKTRDVIKVLGRDVFNNILNEDVEELRGIKLNDEPKEILKKIPVYYFSNDGIYKYFNKDFQKISNKIIPPWKGLLAAFNNPLLPMVRIKVDRWRKEDLFDGGVLDNFAVCPNKDNDYISVACVKKKKKEVGLFSVSDYLLKKYPPVKEKYIKPSGKRAFFEFTDEAIDEEMEGKMTNIFKEDK